MIRRPSRFVRSIGFQLPGSEIDGAYGMETELPDFLHLDGIHLRAY
jgi:hypothetical protein